MTVSVDQPDFALEWCRRLGANPDSLESLQGGINNQVFICKAGQQRFVLKGYQEGLESGHDRFRAEVEFLNYARVVAPEFVPHLVHSDETSRSVVLEYIEGERFTEGTTPSQEDINQAVTFMRLLNRDLETGKDLVTDSAAEGFLRITEHLQNIEQRLDKMGTNHLPSHLRPEAKNLIESGRKRLKNLEDNALKLLAQGYCQDLLDAEVRCLSPSDFGFHNAIRIADGIKFFDFEFAGWDDPVKAVSDFDLQPRVPVKPSVQALRKALPEWSNQLLSRYNCLLPILRLKWCSIILGTLDSNRWKGDAVEDEFGWESLFRAKISLAKPYLTRD